MTITAKGDTVSYGDGGGVGQTANLAVPAGAFVTSVTLVTDTSAYADNDVLVVPQEVTGVATTSLWIAAICRSGTPTYAAASLKLKLAWERC